tara:strand:- start:109 stop:372 length:264 start_codon:yes stop_codon:yes gene_type:complete
MSFIASTNKQLDRYFILIPKSEHETIKPFLGEKIKVNIKNALSEDQLTIISQIIKQGSNYLLSIYSKYVKDFEKFMNQELKIKLDKI